MMGLREKWVNVNTNTKNMTKQNKIAFVGNTSFSIYKFRLGVMKSFVSNGYKVFAIAPLDEYSNLFEKEGINYISIEIQTKSKNIFADLKIITNLSKIYRKNKIDFVFHYTIKPIIYGSIAARLNNTPTVAVTTGLGYTFKSQGFFNWFIIRLYKTALSKVKEVWFLNSHDKQKFIETGIIKENKAFILPSEGIDTNYYAPQKKNDNNETFKFLLLSRLIKGKGVEEYIKAAEKLKKKKINVECQLLGKVESEESIISVPIKEIMNWHDKGVINYLGEFIDIREYISNCDCVVLPTYYMEGVPRCLMEGMSMERPIITTDNVGSNELIIDQVNGFKCEPKNVFSLVEKMEKMINTSIGDRIIMGKNGRQRILDYFDEQKIIEIYQSKIKQYIS